MWLASSYDCVMVADVLNMAGGGEGASAAGHSGTSRTLLHQVNFLSLISLSWISPMTIVNILRLWTPKRLFITYKIRIGLWSFLSGIKKSISYLKILTCCMCFRALSRTCFERFRTHNGREALPSRSSSASRSTRSSASSGRWGLTGSSNSSPWQPSTRQNMISSIFQSLPRDTWLPCGRILTVFQCWGNF